MALTITATRTQGYEQPEAQGRMKVVTLDWSLASTYVTGGHAYTQADLNGINTSQVLEIEFPNTVFRNGTSAILPFWDKANKKIMFFWTGGGAGTAFAEVTNSTSLASYAGKVRVRCYM